LHFITLLSLYIYENSVYFHFYRKEIAAKEVKIGKAAEKLKEEKPVTLPSDDVTFKKWG